jgi:hypothetical protein
VLLADGRDSSGHCRHLNEAGVLRARFFFLSARGVEISGVEISAGEPTPLKTRVSFFVSELGGQMKVVNNELSHTDSFDRDKS